MAIRLLAVALLLIPALPRSLGAIGPDAGTGKGCEDQLGNWFPSPDHFASGIRPDGPCLPLGTWDWIRQREREQSERIRQLEERLRRLEAEAAPSHDVRDHGRE